MYDVGGRRPAVVIQGHPTRDGRLDARSVLTSSRNHRSSAASWACPRDGGRCGHGEVQLGSLSVRMPMGMAVVPEITA